MHGFLTINLLYSSANFREIFLTVDSGRKFQYPDYEMHFPAPGSGYILSSATLEKLVFIFKLMNSHTYFHFYHQAYNQWAMMESNGENESAEMTLSATLARLGIKLSDVYGRDGRLFSDSQSI